MVREIGKARIVLFVIKMRLPAVVAFPDFEIRKEEKKRMLFEPIKIMDD